MLGYYFNESPSHIDHCDVCHKTFPRKELQGVIVALEDTKKEKIFLVCKQCAEEKISTLIEMMRKQEIK